MKLHVYSIYDLKTEAFGTPFFSVNDAVARRSFMQLRADPNSTVFGFPEDFKLFHLGEFTDEDGALVPQSPIRLVAELETSKEK